jgi:hypothetical protein
MDGRARRSPVQEAAVRLHWQLQFTRARVPGWCVGAKYAYSALLSLGRCIIYAAKALGRCTYASRILFSSPW